VAMVQAAGVLAQIEKGNKKKQGIQVKYVSVVDNIFVVFSCLRLS